jgi:hypothetical protein
MSTFYLVNRIKLGTRLLLPGALIDDAQEDTAAIAAAGGLLITSSDATIATAAALAQQLSLRGQHLDAAFIMLAAATKSSAGDDLSVDLASVAAGKGLSRVGVEDAALRFVGVTGEAVTAELGGRVGAAVADGTAMLAIPAATQSSAQIVVDLSTNDIWILDVDSAVAVDAWTRDPTAGSGRFVRPWPSLADLASQATGFGASLIGVDATNNNLEVALAAVKAKADAAPAFQAVAAGAMVSGTLTISTGLVIATASEVVPILRGAVTGSNNFGSLRELVSSRVNGGAGVGTVVIQAVDSMGAIDVDAAVASGLIHVVVLTAQ